jgi:hypothetical protein
MVSIVCVSANLQSVSPSANPSPYENKSKDYQASAIERIGYDFMAKAICFTGHLPLNCPAGSASSWPHESASSELAGSKADMPVIKPDYSGALPARAS